MKPSRLFVVLLAIASAACSTLKISTDYDPATDFSKYKTFAIKTGSAPKDTISADRARSALANALSQRGLKQAEEGADLNLFPHFVLGKETQINTSGYGYGGWHGWGWGGGMQTTTVQQIPTGTLVVDLVDTSTKKVVWRGIAKDQISTSATPEERQQKAAEVAAELFKNFPPKKK